MPKGEKVLWDISVYESEKTEKAQKEKEATEDGKIGDEASILFFGGKESGKTTIICRFLDREDIPKSTIALEYTFGRRAKGHNLGKDIGHIWELGGGTNMTQLLEVPINLTNIMTLSLVLVVDLSRPEVMWTTLEVLLRAVTERVNQVVKKLSVEDPQIEEKLKRKAWSRFTQEHPDRGLIEPSLVPLVIIGTKYDLYQNLDSEKRKVISRTLRFVAHNYGGALLFCSSKNEPMMTRTRSLVSHLVFGTTLNKAYIVDHNKPIAAAFGTDSMQQIGSPPIADGAIGQVQARSPMELWKQAFTSYFPQQTTGSDSTSEDPAKDQQYAEPEVDNMRAQKDEVLEEERIHQSNKLFSRPKHSHPVGET
ncbi:cytoplasmic dynein 2 light intermediate chain 1-like isoform X2 [Anneissia japonica]|uniref:cytoplasmic dynein 2 light intermediate chain 1-like isoform X2 n=1 Tax=Anneissia japonica TaxID=1529436 RepID=UPI00142561AD|nr:cytoplasmic dynein 2 light intermediate chain 1-like isoform X2 [Anneissia japonica]